MTATSFNKALGAAIDKLRKARGLTYQNIGDALGVSYQQVAKYLCGTNGIAAHSLPLIASLLGVTVGELFELAGHPPAGRATDAQNDSFMVARYVSRIKDAKLRGSVVDFTRKLAFQAGGAA